MFSRSGGNPKSFAIYSPTDPENQNLEQKKKMVRDIILQMCTRNDNHMMYGSWDMECDRHDFLSFWTNFCPFTSLKTWKINILKNEENTWRYYHFTNVSDK